MLKPIPRLRAWLGFGWGIPVLPSHGLWGSSVCQARPRHSDGWGLERSSGDTGMRVRGPNRQRCVRGKPALIWGLSGCLPGLASPASPNLFVYLLMRRMGWPGLCLRVH